MFSYSETSTSHVAVIWSCWVVTVILVCPVAMAVTVPVSSTFAILGLSLLQITLWFLTLSGITVATRVHCCPTPIIHLYLSRRTSVTCTLLSSFSSLTVTLQNAVKPPSSVVTVIIVLPGLTAFTTPVSLTVAILVFRLLQVIFWLVASTGVITAVRGFFCPTSKVRFCLSRLTPVTAILRSQDMKNEDKTKKLMPHNVSFVKNLYLIRC